MRAAAAPKQDNWVFVPASASSVPAGVLAPGAFIDGGIAESGGGCTLGSWIRGGDLFVTAGHCDRYGDTGILNCARRGLLRGLVTAVSTAKRGTR